MDFATILGGSAGLGGLVVSLYGISRTRQSSKESVVVRHIEIALAAQQDQLNRQATLIDEQDRRIRDQNHKIDAQDEQIRELRVRVIRCDQEKRQLQRELATIRRTT